MIEFTRSWWLLLLPLPVVAWYALPVLPVKRALILPVGVWQALTRVSGKLPFGAPRFSASSLAAVTGWLALLLALAQPMNQIGELPQHTGRSMIIAVDLSASMGEELGESSRFQTVRTLLTEFIASRQGDRIALIAFGDHAYLVSPFTYDIGAVNSVLAEMTIGLPGRKTDLGQPIGLAVKLLQEVSTDNSNMVIVTDGETNTGLLSATDAARMAEQLGMTLHVIGFASEVNPENSAYMREIAQLTGGNYAEALDANQLQSIYSELDTSVMPQRRDASKPAERLMNDLTWVPLLVALVSLLFYALRLRSEQ